MYLLKKIPCAQVELHWDRELAGGAEMRAKQLRGALAQAFAENNEFHQHDPVTGKSLYRYPMVQYRWRKGCGLVVGWGEIATRLLGLPWLNLALRLGEDPVEVSHAALTLNERSFGVSERLLVYRLVTPVLLFNVENYHRYKKMNEAGQRVEQDRLLVSNFLATMKGLGVEFPERLYGTFIRSKSQPCYYKGQKLIGIEGELISNALLPNDLAIGHAVSHGFGWLTAC